MAEQIEPPSWIYPGAKVLFETTTPGALQKVVRREIVQKITRTQVVLTKTDVRIRLQDLRGVGQQPYGNSYTLLDPNSEEGIFAWRREEVRRIRVAARDAVERLRDGLDDQDRVDRAILSLTRWSETMKTTVKEFL